MIGAALVLLGAARADGPPPVLPEPPALVALTGGGAAFDEPTAPSDIAIAAGDLLDAGGGLRPGGAVELGVRALGLAPRTDPARYRDSALRRAWANTALSFATAAGGAAGDVRGAVGLRSVLWRGHDPWLAPAYRAAAAAAAAACGGAVPADAPDWAAQRQACLDEAYASAAPSPPPWNAAGIVASGALTAGFTAGRLSGAGVERADAWLSGAVPAGARGQVGLAVGGGAGPRSPDRLAATALGRLAVQRTRVLLEVSAVRSVAAAGAPRWELPLRVGGERQVDESVWLAVDFGLRLGPTTDTVTALSQATVRWGQSDAPGFAAPAAAD